MSLTVVLPCYNEGRTIARTVRATDAFLSMLAEESRIIVVNDGSRDDSADVLAALEKEMQERLQVLTHEKNRGYGLAVRTGCDHAETEWIAFMDSDGQFDPRDLALLLARRGEYRFITGRRRTRADPFVRNVFGKVLGMMNLLVLGVWVRDVNCGLKLFEHTLWQNIRPEYGEEKLFNTEMFLRMKRQGIQWCTVDVPHYPRTAGAPTGGSLRVIRRMWTELLALRRAARSVGAKRVG